MIYTRRIWRCPRPLQHKMKDDLLSTTNRLNGAAVGHLRLPVLPQRCNKHIDPSRESSRIRSLTLVVVHAPDLRERCESKEINQNHHKFSPKTKSTKDQLVAKASLRAFSTGTGMVTSVLTSHSGLSGSLSVASVTCMTQSNVNDGSKRNSDTCMRSGGLKGKHIRDIQSTIETE